MGAAHKPAYRRFLKKLKAARKEAGLTQLEVAAKLARPQSFVAKCESGERRIDVVELVLFAEIYGKPISFFVDTAKKRKRGGP